MGAPFTARYDGRCPCGERIYAGDTEIVMEDGVAVHEECADDDDA